MLKVFFGALSIRMWIIMGIALVSAVGVAYGYGYIKAKAAANEHVLRENNRILQDQLARVEAARKDGEAVTAKLKSDTNWAAGEIARLRKRVASASVANCELDQETIDLLNSARKFGR